MPQAASVAGHGPHGRPLSYLQRRLHCRVALSATHHLSPVHDNVPAGRAVADRETADSDDVIVVGCGWTSDTKRAATKFQPKLEPGVHPVDVRAESYVPVTQLTAAVDQPRHDVLTTCPPDVVGSPSRVSRPEPPRGVAAVLSNVDQSTAVRSADGAPPTQPQTVQQNNEPVVKRGRGRPRKYPPKPTTSKKPIKSTLPASAHTTAVVCRPQDFTNDAMRDWLIGDKENVSPAVVAAKRNANDLDRNIWTSSAVRDAASTSKSLQASGVMANKVARLHERQKLAELPVNVIQPDDNNNFHKKPAEKMTSNFRLKDCDKDKLLSVWNALKDTLQSDDWDAINRKDQVGDSTKCQTTEQRVVAAELVGEKRQDVVEKCTTEHQKRPNKVLQTPVSKAQPPLDTDTQHAATKNVHWKCPETDDVKRSDNKIPDVKFFDDPSSADLPKSSFPFVADFDDKLPLSESLGKPLFTSTPIKLGDAATSACSAAATGKRARVRFRPVTQTGDNDEEDASDRVELSKLAALPSMQHGAMSSATQISGVRPADIVRAFRTIDSVAAATSTLHAVPFAMPPTPADLHQAPLVDSATKAGQPDQPLAAEASSPATMTTTSSSNDASPLPSEVVPGQLLHFYGAHYDGPPYNLSPSTGGFVTKAARKRPIVDDVDAVDRKRFQPDVPATAAAGVNTGYVAGDVVAPSSVRQTATAAEMPQPEMSRPPAGSQCRRAAEMTSRGAARDVRRAPNGVPVHDLLRLQRRLSTISDAATLRRVVHIIGETRQYCVNDVTFDFDLCNLDSTTVARLIQCLDGAAVL